MIRFLRRLLMVLAWCVACIAAALLLTFLYYDLTGFQPRQDGITRLIAVAQPAERHPPEALRRLLLTEHRGDPSWSATRILVYDLQVPGITHGNLGREFTELLWQQLVRIHVSDENQMAILCSRTFLGRRAYGYEAGAQAYFERPLAVLTEEDLATLVVIARWPGRWSRLERPDDLVRARDALIDRTRCFGRDACTRAPTMD